MTAVPRSCDDTLDAERFGLDVPLHFTAFHPGYKMLDVAPTPPATLSLARAIAIGNSLHHVYTGNAFTGGFGRRRIPVQMAVH